MGKKGGGKGGWSKREGAWMDEMGIESSKEKEEGKGRRGELEEGVS